MNLFDIAIKNKRNGDLKMYQVIVGEFKKEKPRRAKEMAAYATSFFLWHKNI